MRKIVATTKAPATTVKATTTEKVTEPTTTEKVTEPTTTEKVTETTTTEMQRLCFLNSEKNISLHLTEISLQKTSFSQLVCTAMMLISTLSRVHSKNFLKNAE